MILDIIKKKNSELYHHGILGQKWGVRRFQNLDGSLTEAGRLRYEVSSKKSKAQIAIDSNGEGYDNIVAKFKAMTEDCEPMTDWRKYDKDKTYRERANRAADLGIKTLEKHYGEDLSDLPEKSKREWFLFEDQTIGCGMIADLINQGYSANQISKLKSFVNDNYSLYDRIADEVEKTNQKTDESVWLLYNGYGLEEFAQACEKTKERRT